MTITYHATPCRKCGRDLFKPVSVPMFRVEVCLGCGTHRATTDPFSAAAAARAAEKGPTAVYVVLHGPRDEHSAILSVFANQADAEREITRLGGAADDVMSHTGPRRKYDELRWEKHDVKVGE